MRRIISYLRDNWVKILTRAFKYKFERDIIIEKYMVKKGQYEALTSPPTEAVTCPHATSTLNLNRNTGMYSEN